jgi:hypothetical protein
MSNAPTKPPGEIVCHSVDHFRAAFSAISDLTPDQPPILRTAPGATDYAGVQFLWDIAELARPDSSRYIEVVLDCGDNPATVFGALRTGWTKIAYSGPEQLRKKISSVVKRQGRKMITLNTGPVLDLFHSDQPTTDCAVWITDLQVCQSQSC